VSTVARQALVEFVVPVGFPQRILRSFPDEIIGRLEDERSFSTCGLATRAANTAKTTMKSVRNAKPPRMTLGDGGGFGFAPRAALIGVAYLRSPQPE
jgi:hypothetical protein